VELALKHPVHQLGALFFAQLKTVVGMFLTPRLAVLAGAVRPAFESTPVSVTTIALEKELYPFPAALTT